MRKLLVIILLASVSSCAIFRNDLPEEPGDDSGAVDVEAADTSTPDMAESDDGGAADTDSGEVAADADTSEDSGDQPSYEEIVLADEPVGYWRLNEMMTPVAEDSSGNGHEGIFNGVPELGVPGPFPGAGTAVRFFDEVIEVDDFPQVFADGAPFTVEAWMRPSNVTISGAFVSHSDRPGDDTIGWRLSIASLESGARLRAQRHGHSTLGSGGIQKDEWHHVALIYDGETLIAYRDRAIVSDRTTDLTAGPVSSPLMIGDATSWRNFEGDIDEVAVYDRELSIPELVEHYDVATRP